MNGNSPQVMVDSMLAARQGLLRKRFRSILAAVLSGVVVASLAAVAPAQADPKAPSGQHLMAQVEPLDNVGEMTRGVAWPVKPAVDVVRPAPVWPRAGTASVTLTQADARRTGGAAPMAQAGRLPVSLGRAAGTAGERLSELTVEVLDRAQVSQRWDDGLLMRVAPAANTFAVAGAADGAASLSVDYSGFRYAYGGDWASRLRLWQLPGCAAKTPERSECAPTPLKSTNEDKLSRVSAEVPVSAAGTLVALAAAPSGPEGDFSATSLSPSATWSSGGSTGDFSWSYPMRVPPAIAGPAPGLSLSYSSSSVDGMSETTNNQPSWIGEGFDFSPGYIERRYVACADDTEGSANTEKTGDLCWRSDNATMSLNGRGSELVFEQGKGWHARSEDASKIEKLPGAGNGALNGEHWKVTTGDGMQYFFGLDDLPGQSTATDSTNTVPVYGNHPNEPCNASTFAGSRCVQAWRWNLDYVVDPRGNTMSYWYKKEANNYAARNTASDVVSYTRASTLTRIDYGTWDRGTADRSVTPLAQVLFQTAERCATNCSTHEPVNWPDVPWDQECAQGASSCDDFAPTFWSTRRLQSITTQVWDTTPTPARWQPVDSWTLSHSYPAAGDGSDHAGLWLNSVVHAGHVGDTKTMPPVTFEPVSKPNRVLEAYNTSNNRQRIANIISETGAKLQVTYSQPDCTKDSLPSAPETNTQLCYPVIGPNPTVPGGPETTQWWHKYVVERVSESDLPVKTADGVDHGGPVQNTSYRYLGDPAWHYADDDGLVQPKRKTWNQFRGFSTVETRQGDAPAQTLTTTTYLRGMHGDRIAPAPSTGTRDVTVPASLGGETVKDEDQFAGLVREQIVYNGDDTKPVSKTVNVPWMSPPTASRTINHDTVTARFSNVRITYSATALGVNGQSGWRTTRSESKFDDTYGNPVWSQDDGDTTKTGDEQCVTYTYNREPTRNLLQTVKRLTTTALTCGQAPTSTDDVISDVRNYYDGASSPETPPTIGAITSVDQLKDWTATAGTVWQTVSQTTYDPFGRPKTVTDVRARTTTTTYTPASGGPLTKVTTSSPDPNGGTVAWTGVVETKPYWGAPVKTTDMNGRTSDLEYDPLGRLAKVWKVGWAKTTATANKPSIEYTYEYSANRSAYPYTTAKVLNAAGNYVTAYQIYDAFLRPRQTQTAGVGGNRVVGDTLYDKVGRANVSYSAHEEPGTPEGILWWEPEWSVPAVSKTLYDNASRPTDQVLLGTNGIDNLVEKWRTTTTYTGDTTAVTPPKGATPTTTVTDAQGRTIELRQHTTDQGIAGPSQSTRYTYNRKGLLVKVADPDANEWTYTFDVKGRQIEAKDPDKGKTTSKYNDFDELVETKDANNKILAYDYDDIGRKVGLYDTVISAATKRAAWVYDKIYGGDVVRGQLTRSLRYEPVGSTNAYEQRISDINTRYQPTGIATVIPSAEGAGIAGTWATEYEYSDADGSLISTGYPQVGGLSAEQVSTTYDATTGLPATLTTTLINEGSYVTGQTYTRYGEPEITTRKTSGQEYVDDITEYDPITRRVTHSSVKPQNATGTVSDRHYEYDDAGNITSINDTPAAGTTDNQCFTYDNLSRLTSAWTPKTGISCDTAPSTANLGGPAPYWQDWTFDKVGNRLQEITHTTAGDTKRTYTVPTGGSTVIRPHAVTAVKTEAPGQAPVTTNYAYDDTGNMSCRPTGTTANTCPPGANSQTLLWDPEGHLSTVSGPGQSNIYDADGSRIIRRDSTGTTLYLPGQEVRRQGTNGTVTTTRYYTFAGKLIASRTPTALTWLYTDHQGTQHTTIDASNPKAITTRRQTPYGGPRGTQPVWPTPKGFVGGDNDPTGLTHLGAREYDPTLGRFTSVDPIQDLTDPQQWHGYAYSHNSPVTYSDPSGMIDCDFASCGMGGRNNSGPKSQGQAGGGKPGGGRSDSDTPTPEKPDLRCQRAGTCDPAPESPFSEPVLTPAEWLEEMTGRAVADLGSLEIRNELQKRFCHYNRSVCDQLSEDYDALFAAMLRDLALDMSGVTDAQECIEGSVSGCAWTATNFIPFGKLGKAGKSLWALRALGKACSFSGDTEVLMADGTTKKIAEIKIGDEVLASDPETGEQGPRRVTNLWIHQDKVTGFSVAGQVLTTTEDHPFWNNTDKEWQRADAIDRGDMLLAADGRGVVVDGLVVRSSRIADAYNLTVDGIRTYYVMAGKTPVLVHNTNCGNLWGGKQDGWQHVLDEHVNGSPGVVPGNTTFSDHLDLDDISDLIEDTAQRRGVPNHGTNPLTGQTRDGTIHRENFGYPIGSNGENSVEVVLNPDGSLRTAYPVFGGDQ
ncbi:polymorphic toxin-type HINT domain-containing protein [Micromonospora sp. NPDC050417]|uniref:polymorphic toxin-type HINT domain-containing protein n=1 Tax=Micromonospora sp. NPDC050417 TaxID=3364280 RepID=UPI003789F0DA